MSFKKISCEYVERGRASCKATLPNGKEVRRRYQDVKPEFMDAVERDFKQNILTPEIRRMQSEKGILGKGIKFLREKPPSCWGELSFENKGDSRIVKEIGKCVTKEERIEKIGKNIERVIGLIK